MPFAVSLALLLLPAVWPQDAPADLKKEIDAYKEVLKDRNRANDAMPYLDAFMNRYKANDQELLSVAERLELKEGDAGELKKRQKALNEEQKTLVEAVSWTFSAYKQVTEDNLRLWRQAAFAFGQMGSLGAENLLKAFEDKRFNKEVEFRAVLVENVGHTKDYTRAKNLVDFLEYKDDLIIAAAARAMEKFKGAPGQTRKFMVENLVKQLESYHNAASDNTNTIAISRYTTVRSPMIEALKALTSESFADPLDWTKWWNNNKNRPDTWKDPS